MRFGTTLRCSPQKRDVGKRFTIPAADQTARKALNFSGGQHDRVLVGAASSNMASNGSNMKGGSGADGRRYGGREGGRGGSEADTAELTKGVASMSMGSKQPGANSETPDMGRGRVSGLDSYMGSSDTSSFKETPENLSLLERLRRRGSGQGKFREDVEDGMDIDRQKRCKEPDDLGRNGSDVLPEDGRKSEGCDSELGWSSGGRLLSEALQEGRDTTQCPVRSNECFGMELPGVGELPNSS